MKIKILDLPKGHSKFVHKPTRVTFYTVHRMGTKEPVEQRYSMGDPLVLRVGDVVIVGGTEVPSEFQPLTKNRFAEVLPENEQAPKEEPAAEPEPEPEPVSTETPDTAPKSEPKSEPSSKPIEPIK